MKLIWCFSSKEKSEGLQFWRQLPLDFILVFGSCKNSTFHNNNVGFNFCAAALNNKYEVLDKSIIYAKKNMSWKPPVETKFVLEIEETHFPYLESYDWERILNASGYRHLHVSPIMIKRKIRSHCGTVGCPDAPFDLRIDDLISDNNVWLIVKSISEDEIECWFGNSEQEAINNKIHGAETTSVPKEQIVDFNVLDKAVLYQGTDYNCGPVALEYVFSKLGIDIDQQQLEQELDTDSDEGTDIDNIYAVLQHTGIESSLHKVQDIKDSDAMKLALIQDRGRRHFIVIEKIDEDFVLYFDPYDGGIRKIDKNYFNQMLENPRYIEIENVQQITE